jgi:hypothetical protein
MQMAKQMTVQMTTQMSTKMTTTQMKTKMTTKMKPLMPINKKFAQMTMPNKKKARLQPRWQHKRQPRGQGQMTTPDENDVRIRDDFEFILNCNNTRS